MINIIVGSVLAAVFSLWAWYFQLKLKNVVDVITEFKLMLEKDFVRVNKFEEQNKIVSDQIADAKMGRTNLWATLNDRTKEITKLITDINLTVSNKITEIITILKIKGIDIDTQSKD